MQATFANFSRDQGWIVAVIPSGNPTAWSREEVELAGRVLGRLENAYRLDPLRIVVGDWEWAKAGNFGCGHGSETRQRDACDWHRAREARAPRRELAARVVAVFVCWQARSALAAPVRELDESGFWAQVVPMPESTGVKWESIPVDRFDWSVA